MPVGKVNVTRTVSLGIRGKNTNLVQPLVIKVKIIKNSSVVIYGVGGLGLLAVNAAKNLKANPIIVIDIVFTGKIIHELISPDTEPGF